MVGVANSARVGGRKPSGAWAMGALSLVPCARVCTAVPPPPHDDDHKGGAKMSEARTHLKAEGTARVPLADLTPQKSVPMVCCTCLFVMCVSAPMPNDGIATQHIGSIQLKPQAKTWIGSDDEREMSEQRLHFIFSRTKRSFCGNGKALDLFSKFSTPFRWLMLAKEQGIERAFLSMSFLMGSFSSARSASQKKEGEAPLSSSLTLVPPRIAGLATVYF